MISAKNKLMGHHCTYSVQLLIVLQTDHLSIMTKTVQISHPARVQNYIFDNYAIFYNSIWGYVIS